jgi:hypothetical protein
LANRATSGVTPTDQTQLPAVSRPKTVAEADGAASTGDATTHNNPVITMLFQDIRFSPPS